MILQIQQKTNFCNIIWPCTFILKCAILLKSCYDGQGLLSSSAGITKNMDIFDAFKNHKATTHNFKTIIETYVIILNIFS